LGAIDYKIEIEIFECHDCDHHSPGQKFRYPEEIGKICPWLLDSINTMARVMQFGGTLPWKYEGTKYQKEINAGVTTTEYVRCPDPTDSTVVVKLTRRKLSPSKEVGWA
jgi:uncharacterized repeat protein (TIGR04076 family)